MTKPTKSHLDTAQRIYDRLGRGSVADIDAIAQALAEAERDGERKGIREGKMQAAEIANNHSFACDVDWWLIATKKEVSAESCWSVARAILSTITDEAE